MDPKNKRIQLTGDLFETVQKKRIFPDSKLFVDMVPKIEPDRVNRLWVKLREEPLFDLKTFVLTYFEMPEEFDGILNIKRKKECREHIRSLWPGLFRRADKAVSEYDSLLPLSHPYVVQSGRSRDIHYWDSYFISQGLRADGHEEMILNMAKNFKDLINRYGFIPAGNREYYLSRSQPPFFAPMAEMVIQLFGSEKIEDFLPAVEKEYEFWMDRQGREGRRLLHVKTIDHAGPDEMAVESVHRMNRYWDEETVPRRDQWLEDLTVCDEMKVEDRTQCYRNIRAACESGWDFSSRWLSNGKQLSTIETVNILPIDLNTLLWYMEQKISYWNFKTGNDQKARSFEKKAFQRKRSIHKLMWSQSEGFFFDYHILHKKHTSAWSLAAVYPLYFGLATADQATKVADHLENKFMKKGGLVTTLQESGHQWDAPNGWAPMQWMAISGLKKYGFDLLAEQISIRWRNLNKRTFQQTGRMTARYNVIDCEPDFDGRVSSLQNGYGWTNGVYCALDDMAG